MAEVVRRPTSTVDSILFTLVNLRVPNKGTRYTWIECLPEGRVAAPLGRSETKATSPPEMGAPAKGGE